MVRRFLIFATLLSYVVMQQPQRGPYCFQCGIMASPDQCNNAVTCDQGQVCMLTENTLVLDGHPTYKTACASPWECQLGEQVSLIGKKRTTRCHTCCQSDFCNNKCDYEQVTSINTPLPIVTQPPHVPTKPATTTTEIHVTSSPTGSRAISVPTKPTTTSTQQTTHPTTTTTTSHTHAAHSASSKPTTSKHNVTSHSFRELCERNRYHYDEHSKLCYTLHDDQATWDEANNRCKNTGGMLAVIDTPEKWHLLQRSIAHHYHDDVYIGGRGHGTHSTDYHWTNGARFEFSAWAHGQPDSSHEECVVVDPNDHHWHDAYCHYHLKFVCTMEQHV